jgi:hypothetical protein
VLRLPFSIKPVPVSVKALDPESQDAGELVSLEPVIDRAKSALIVREPALGGLREGEGAGLLGNLFPCI